MGIDPGSQFCGYGLLDEKGVYVASGRLELGAGAPLHIRLRELHEGLESVVKEYRPQVASVEKIFFAKSVRAALSLGHARGVALLVAAANGLELFEYSALEVKKAITGYGRAEKRQVADMVQRMLGLRGTLSPDSADALALALCHRTVAAYSKMVGVK